MLEQRDRLPIERAFAERVARSSGAFFKPVALRDTDSVKFHRQLSYLVDAFDALPERVDIAFDSAWKALELASTESALGNIAENNITDRLKFLPELIDVGILNHISAGFPLQSCEYLFKRLISAVRGDEDGMRLNKRVKGLNDEQINYLLEYMLAKYGDDADKPRRNGALLLRKALRGDILIMGQVSDFRLEDSSRARILISLFLYTARNDRFHGESFSPFVSSAATLRTYTHPHFAFMASYYLLLGVWARVYQGVVVCDNHGIMASIDDNFEAAIETFGRHWG